MKRGGIVWIFGYCMLCAVSLAQAQITAFTFDDPNEGTESTTGTDGFKFRPIVDIQVTDLGYYDRDQDGLALVHPVSIYDFDTQRLLVSADVGSTSFLDGLFRYTSIAPFTLNAGVSYMVAGFSPSGEDIGIQFDFRSDVSDTNEVMLEQYFFLESSEPIFPTNGILDPIRFFGPNFRYNVGGGDLSAFDFNDDGSADCADINALATGVASNAANPEFDLNQDFQLDVFDVEDWLLRAGLGTTGTAYDNGDGNLDGTVGGGDFAIWESHHFMAGSWCDGDFNADGLIDGSDFNIWNNAYQSAAAATSVPEPKSLVLLLLATLGLRSWGRRRRSRGGSPVRNTDSRWASLAKLNHDANGLGTFVATRELRR